MSYEEVSAEELNDYLDNLEKENRELKSQVEQLKPLARRCLWGALVWNDHNFDQPLHFYCRKSASEAGIFTIDQANSFLDKDGE